MGTARSEPPATRHAGPVCGTCKQPLGEEITRYKTMGVVVPVWKAAACRNPDCPEGEAEHAGPTKPDPLRCLHELRSGTGSAEPSPGARPHG
jgi:hypothetical protein